VEDLAKLDPKTQAALIAHTVGEKKRVLILDEAKKTNIKILNPHLKRPAEPEVVPEPPAEPAVEEKPPEREPSKRESTETPKEKPRKKKGAKGTKRTKSRKSK
jgi:hypothetical protein